MSARRSRQNIDVRLLALPPAESDGGADGEHLDLETLRSFTLEVSAGRRPQGVADATDAAELRVDPPAESTRRREARQRRSRRARAEAAPTIRLSTGAPPIAAAPIEPEAPARNQVSAPPLEIASIAGDSASSDLPRPPSEFRALTRSSARSPRHAVPSWAVSLFTHAGIFAFLATITLATEDRPIETEAYITPLEPEQLDLATIEPATTADVAQPEVTDASPDLIDPGAMGAFGQVTVDSALNGIATNPGVFNATDGLGLGGPPGDGPGPMGQAGSPTGKGKQGRGKGSGTGKFGDGLGGDPLAKFFGQEIDGHRIVFVLDNSGSMQGGRLETVIAELLRCVGALAKDQEFYVLFHSDAVYPLFYPDPVQQYLQPTDANKKLLARWLDTVELCLGDSVDEALVTAELIQPDTVFLLSDGRIQSEKKYRYLVSGGPRNFALHTFAVGLGSSVAGRRNLQTIAEANHGQFRESEVPAEMRDLARRKPRPYHSETPGPVWGRKVKPFRTRG
jgi:hypothetical protein